MIKKLLVYVMFFSLALSVSAQSSDTYTIRMLVGNDTTAPTTPSIISTIPQSTSQIDIAWTAASDNVYVSGYRVFRDGIFIATTTLTTFIDTGLTASTTYSYTVDAFDPFFNFSSTSAPLATTTLAIPVIPPTPTSTESAPANPTALAKLRSFLATPTQTSISLAIASYGPTKYTVRWGRTDAGEMGQISTSIFRQEHTSFIPNLEPGTEYVVILYLTNRFGVAEEAARERVRTLPALMSDAPLAVTSLVGAVRDTDAVLRWKNPEQFDMIRVVRSHLFYPLSPTDGVVVYEGRGESFTDSGIFAERSPYYYSVFAYSGGRSSAPAVVRLSKSGDPITTPQVPTPPTDTGVGTSNTPIVQTPLVLSAENVFVTVDNQKTLPFTSFEDIPVGSQVLVSIPKNAVLPNIKTIILSLTDPVDSRIVTRYLMTLNPDRTAYEVQFQINQAEGLSRWEIEVFDYELAMVRSVERTVRYTNGVTLGLGSFATAWYALAAFVLASFFGLVFWCRSRREDNR
jgi:hypothetical protein